MFIIYKIVLKHSQNVIIKYENLVIYMKSSKLIEYKCFSRIPT